MADKLHHDVITVSFSQQPHAVMEMWEWWEVTQSGREDWKCVSVRGGALSMLVDGQKLTLKSPADN